MLNNKDLQCLPRAEINNSLTGKVGKQAVRDRGSWEPRRNLGVGEEAVWLESTLGTADAGTSGPRGWGSKVWDRLGQKESLLARQTQVYAIFCHFLAEHSWVSFSEPSLHIYEMGCFHGPVVVSMKHLQCASLYAGH